MFRIEVFLTSVMMMIQQYNLLSSSGSDRTGFQVYLPNSSSSTFNFQIVIFLFSWIWFVCLFNNTSFSSLHASGLKIILRESMLFITFTKFWPILPQYMRALSLLSKCWRRRNANELFFLEPITRFIILKALNYRDSYNNILSLCNIFSSVNGQINVPLSSLLCHIPKGIN